MRGNRGHSTFPPSPAASLAPPRESYRTGTAGVKGGGSEPTAADTAPARIAGTAGAGTSRPPPARAGTAHAGRSLEVPGDIKARGKRRSRCCRKTEQRCKCSQRRRMQRVCLDLQLFYNVRASGGLQSEGAQGVTHRCEKLRNILRQGVAECNGVGKSRNTLMKPTPSSVSARGASSRRRRPRSRPAPRPSR